MLARLISAFGNAEGGVVLVGVGDRGEIVGVDVEEASRAFHRALSEVTSPPKVDLEAVTVDGRQIAIITVGKSERLVLSGDGAFVRVGDRSEPMPSMAIAGVLAEREEVPDSEAMSLAEAIHRLTVRVEQLHVDQMAANTFRGQMPNYLIGGIIGAVLGWLVSKLLG
jgi:predicted HTH transcriptional regulator